MGNAHALRGRLTPVVVVAVLLALAVISTLGVIAGPAAAQDNWSTTTCGSCHDQTAGDAFHNQTTHKSLSCSATCHSTGYATPDTGSCGTASCHGTAAQIIAAQPATHGTCSTGGCHAAPTQATTTLTAKVSPTSVKVKKSVKISGVAGPAASLAGAKVSLKVERKVGTKWVKMKTGTATVQATTGAYSWSYKTAKKGSHRVTASIAAKAGVYTAKKLAPKSFKVK
jgi:hypothetical protein